MKRLTTNEDVYGLFAATTASAALGAAIRTGLLWMLVEKPMHAASIVQILNIPGKRGYYWLQYLESIGVLEMSTEGYKPSPVVRSAILCTRSQEIWQHLFMDEAEKDGCVHGLPQFLSDPGSLWSAQGLAEPKSYVDKMRDDPARAREFTRMLYELHKPLAQEIAEHLDLTGIQRMMDLGGGSGVVSMELLRKHPELTSTVVDIENVCVAGRELAREQGLEERISYHAADFETGDFPKGFDLVLQCDVCVLDNELYKKVWSSLNPGGRYVLVEHLSLDEYSAPATRLEWTFLDSLRDPDFAFPTLHQLNTVLQEIGFEVSSEHHVLKRGMIVLQAWKNDTVPHQEQLER